MAYSNWKGLQGAIYVVNAKTKKLVRFYASILDRDKAVKFIDSHPIPLRYELGCVSRYWLTKDGWFPKTKAGDEALAKAISEIAQSDATRLGETVNLLDLQNMSDGLRRVFFNDYGAKIVVIYSAFYAAFWRPEAQGHTDRLSEAGVWDLKSAFELTRSVGVEKRLSFIYLEVVENVESE